MKLKLEVLTPVHISSGSEISPSGYYIDKKSTLLNVVNMDGLLADPAFRIYEQEFINNASRSRYLGAIIKEDHNLLSRHVLYSLPTTTEFRAANTINIKAFIKSAGRVYIPGSSIKGAIISALLYQALLDLGNRIDLSQLLSSSRKSAYDELLGTCYDYLSGNTQAFRARTDDRGEIGQKKFINLLSVSDTSQLKPEQCLRADICQVTGSRSSRAIPIMYETLKKGSTFELELKNTRCKFSEKEILQICDGFYKKVAAKENLSYSKEPHLLRLGQGSSRFAVSFLIAAEELKISNYKLRPPKTRKRVMDGGEKAMGFVRIYPA